MKDLLAKETMDAFEKDSEMSLLCSVQGLSLELELTTIQFDNGDSLAGINSF